MLPTLKIETVPISPHCVGDRWTVQEHDQLVKLIATIAMGQAVHAAEIIRKLRPAEAALKHEALKKAAIKQLTIPTGAGDQAVWARDGFLFEAVSWIAAQQQSSSRIYLKDPHLKSTSQGIDGLMIELEDTQDVIARATIFEDKCSEDPQAIFSSKVLPGFKVHHENQRAPELLAIAASLIEKANIEGQSAVEIAGRVLDLDYRRYRAALAVTTTDDSESRRKKVFQKYDVLKGLQQSQRWGASFVVSGDLRKYFSALADDVVNFIKAL